MRRKVVRHGSMSVRDPDIWQAQRPAMLGSLEKLNLAKIKESTLVIVPA